jgi:hypothetical protein
MPKAEDGEQTTNGYEYIEYRTFMGVGETRYMSWKGGLGKIFTGGETTHTKADTDNIVLPKGHNVVVYKTCFKLALS